MAIVKGNLIGNLSGKLGDFSARIVNNRTILATRPSVFNVSQSPAAIAVRQKFACTAKFSKNVLSIPILRSIWHKNISRDISVYNAIFKYNYPFTTSDRPTVQNILTPGGFALPVLSAKIESNIVEIELAALNGATEVDGFDEGLVLIAFIVSFNPFSENNAPFGIIKLYQDIDKFDFAVPYTLTMSWHESQTAEAAEYQNSILLLTAVINGDHSNVLKYAKTYAKEF